LHFEAVPKIDYRRVSRLEDLTSTIELYNTMIGLERFDDAYLIFRDRLSAATHYRLSASRQRIELLELLFPDSINQLPRLSRPGRHAFTLNALATGYHLNGQPSRAVTLYHRANAIDLNINRSNSLGVGLGNLANSLRTVGALFESESNIKRALLIHREQEDFPMEMNNLILLGSTLMTRGETNKSESALQKSLRISVASSYAQRESVVDCLLAQKALWLGEFQAARSFANRAWELAHVHNLEGDFIRTLRLQGVAALGLKNLNIADERLHHTLTRARQVNLVEEELSALIALAELRRQERNPGEARELLDDVWEGAERGPYPLFHADALNVLAQIERNAGNTAKAIEAATQAYRLAWCDGPPYAYHWGLEAARKHLRELGAPEPELPPFDPAKFEPMPEVEIDPEDEFHAGQTNDGGAENI
jgi:tetratricopeptide (TPR) repeat protein